MHFIEVNHCPKLMLRYLETTFVEFSCKATWDRDYGRLSGNEVLRGLGCFGHFNRNDFAVILSWITNGQESASRWPRNVQSNLATTSEFGFS